MAKQGWTANKYKHKHEHRQIDKYTNKLINPVY